MENLNKIIILIVITITMLTLAVISVISVINTGDTESVCQLLITTALTMLGFFKVKDVIKKTNEKK